MTTIKKFLVIPSLGVVPYWSDEYTDTDMEVFRFDLVNDILEIEHLTPDGWQAIDPSSILYGG